MVEAPMADAFPFCRRTRPAPLLRYFRNGLFGGHHRCDNVGLAEAAHETHKDTDNFLCQYGPG
jgi:hypothetical protein